MRNRHNSILLLACLGFFAALGAPSPTLAHTPFGYANVVAKAKALAAKPFVAPTKIPDFLSNLSYDQYRDIRFRVENSLWKQSRTQFQVQLLHPGLFYKHSVGINVIDAQGVHPVAFSPTLFDYGDNHFASKVPPHLGFAGFKLTFPLDGAHSRNQFLVFAGASYFRAVGHDQVWGLSARGLAIDTGLSIGEEFPYFKSFWLVRPSPDADEMVVYGLLDSQSISGAYRFVIQPGTNTVMQVEATLFKRTPIKRLGIAPLTSMFFYGEGGERPAHYWRPEVHDSDGLLIHSSNGEWIWRPLINPKKLTISAFDLNNPHGFGLLQRDRHFRNYQDLETRYDKRPSAWVTPEGHWGHGHVVLVEIPSNNETNDNIVAFWVPGKTASVGHAIHFRYQLRWTANAVAPVAIGTTKATYIGRGDQPGYTRFVLDFGSPTLSALPANMKVSGVITVGDGGKLISSHVEKNPVTGGWRLAFQIMPPNKPLELRVFLKSGHKTLSETWSYLLPPRS